MDRPDPVLKLHRLMETLAESQELASLVNHLEIGNLPTCTSPRETIQQALWNCKKLRTFHWDVERRPTSFSAIDVLRSLHNPSQLSDLQIGKLDDGDETDYVLNFTQLLRLSVKKPTENLRLHMVPWLTSIGSTLTSLTLVDDYTCDRPWVPDDYLRALSKPLKNLEHLRLICLNITNSLFSIVSSNPNGLLSLELDRICLFSDWDLAGFANNCLAHSVFRRLTSVTLVGTGAAARPDLWTTFVIQLLADSPLTEFQFRWADGRPILEQEVMDEFWDAFVKKHGHRLVQLTSDKLPVTAESFSRICSGCPVLEKILMSLEDDAVGVVQESLAGTAIRNAYFNFNRDVKTEVPLVLQLFNHGPKSLRRFGYNGKAWIIEEHVEKVEDGTLEIKRVLDSVEEEDL